MTLTNIHAGWYWAEHPEQLDDPEVRAAFEPEALARWSDPALIIRDLERRHSVGEAGRRLAPCRAGQRRTRRTAAWYNSVQL